MAAVSVGKIRREPCAKCRLPVFLAERLNIGKLLYHRTCFRCARCNSQLTIASYYETENGEFCCEVCPDEEKLMAKASHEKVVLQKSLSDEEKSANLKLITGPSDDYSELFETALENVVSSDKVPSEFSEARSSFFRSQIGAESSSEKEVPPLLPKTVPPELDKIARPSEDLFAKSAGSDSGFPKTRLSEVRSNKVSVENNSNSTLELSHNIVTKDKQADDGGNISLVKARARLFESNIADTSKSDVHRNSKDFNKVPKSPIKSTIPIINLDELENFDNFSKRTYDNDTDDKKINTTRTTVVDNISNKDTLIKDTHQDNKPEVDEVVQQEVDILKKPEISKGENEQDQNEPDIVVSHKIKNVASDVIKTPETSESNETDLELKTEIIDLTNASPVKEINNSVTDTEKLSEVTDDPIIEISDTSCERNDSTQNSSDIIVINDSMEKRSPSVASIKSKGDQDYPDDLNPFGEEEESEETESKSKSLNPFGSDEEDEEVIKRPSPPPKPQPTPRLLKKIIPDKQFYSPPIQVQRESINPFDSSAEEEEQQGDGPPPVPAARKKKLAAPKISLNPFWSEDEENEDNLRQPVPKPR